MTKRRETKILRRRDRWMEEYKNRDEELQTNNHYLVRKARSNARKNLIRAQKDLDTLPVGFCVIPDRKI